MDLFGCKERRAIRNRERQIDDCVFWLERAEQNDRESVLAMQVMHTLYDRDVIDTAEAVRNGTAINLAGF